MASVKIASHNYFAFENSLSNPARTDSFSSYLNFIKENFLPELENSAPERLSCQISLNRQKAANREIDVFDAEKYFSEKLDDDRRDTTKISPKKPPSSRDAKSRARKPRSSAGSTCSDSSSNVSQRTLLRDHSSKVSRGQRADASGRSKFLGVFPCPCAGKNAVSVVREAHPRGSSMDYRRDWAHAGRGGDGRMMRDPRMHGVGLELRDNIYAGLPQHWKNPVKPEMELIQEEKVGVPKAALQKGDLLSLSAKKITADSQDDAIIGGFNRGRDGNVDEDEDDDVASETSSDLFEIEAISVNSQPFFSRQGTESTTGYEPSEASIDWSVATAAAAADFPPASEFKDSGMMSTHGASRPPRLQRPGLFMACASDKAVDVSKSSLRKPERVSFDVEEQSCPEGSAAAVARYRAESCGVMNVDSSCNTARVVSQAPFASGRSIGTRARVPYGDA